MSNRRKLRARRPKQSAHYDRGGGVVQTTSPYGPMKVLDGGRDAPARPDSPLARAIAWIVLGITLAFAVVALVLRFA